ncbi:hypothetical protein [Piscirickettsia litoralis]|nr:hypothetical protein [Piscirickettsia litoralis]
MSLAENFFTHSHNDAATIIADNLLLQASSSVFCLLFEINCDQKF